MITKMNAILSLNPNAKVCVRGDVVEWLESPILTDAEIDAELARLTSREGKPSSCTMKQARLALLQVGKLDQVIAAINGMPLPQGTAAHIIWEFSPVVDKHDALVQQLAPVLNLTDTQLDDLFALAVTL